MTQPKITILALSDMQHAALVTVITNYSQTLLDTLAYKAEIEARHPGKVDFLYVESCLAYCEMLLGHFAQAEKQGQTIH